MMATRPVRDVTSAIKARHRKQVRRRVMRVGITAAVVLLIAAVIWATWFSPLFVAKSVRVSGNSQASAQEVIDAAQVPLGTPLVRIDTEAIRVRVLALPAIADAEIGREISGVVTIRVTESVATYVIPQGNRYLIVSELGRAYLTVDSPPADLPIVRLTVDDSLDSQRLMADAAVIVIALPESVRSRMSSMTATTPDTFTISISGGATILWGSAEQSELKAQVIDSLLNVKASHYDVSSPSHPATR